MTYAFKIIFIQEHVKKLLGRGTNEMRDTKNYSSNDGRQRTVKVRLK